MTGLTPLLPRKNLSDLYDVGTARNNLGLGSQQHHQMAEAHLYDAVESSHGRIRLQDNEYEFLNSANQLAQVVVGNLAATQGITVGGVNVVRGSLGATANRVLVTSGTGGATAQSSPVAIDLIGNVTGVGNLNASGALVVNDGTKNLFRFDTTNNGQLTLTAQNPHVQSVSLQARNGTTGAPTFASNAGFGVSLSNGVATIQFTGSTEGTTITDLQGSLGTIFVPRNTLYPAAIFRGVASQSANLTEWQNSSGTVLASVGPTGNLTASGNFDANGVGEFGNSSLSNGSTILRLTNQAGTLQIANHNFNSIVKFSRRIAAVGGFRVEAASSAFGTMVRSETGTGILLLQNDALNDFNRIQLGGTTNSFPAIKRNNNTVQIRLADDSDFAPLSCSNVTTSSNYQSSNINMIFRCAGIGGVNGSWQFQDVNGSLRASIDCVSGQFQSDSGLAAQSTSRQALVNVVGLDLIRGDILRSRSASFGSVELGLTAQENGWEINNGILGTLRDLSLRNLTASGTVSTVNGDSIARLEAGVSGPGTHSMLRLTSPVGETQLFQWHLSGHTFLNGSSDIILRPAGVTALRLGSDLSATFAGAITASGDINSDRFRFVSASGAGFTYSTAGIMATGHLIPGDMNQSGNFNLDLGKSDLPWRTAYISTVTATGYAYRTGASDPSTLDIAAGQATDWHNTTTLTTKRCINIGGTIKSLTYA